MKIFFNALTLGALIAVCSAGTAQAEDDGSRTSHNVLHLELTGNALFYSINYERFLLDDLAVRVGLGYFSVSASTGSESADASLYLVPIMANWTGIGGQDNKMELGIGMLLFHASAGIDVLGFDETDSVTIPLLTTSIAYRYVPHDGGFNFKIGLAPVFGGGIVLPWPSLAFGAVF